MIEIGGYFGLDLRNNGDHYHNKAICLNTGRNCFEYILRKKMYSKVYIPYYTCDVMLEPLNKLNVDYKFYHITESLDPVLPSCITDNDAVLYTNYFGIKQRMVKELSQKYRNLIVDNVQAFFSEPQESIDTFYSPRKFFGVPDGAYLYTDSYLNDHFPRDLSYSRFEHLLKRIDLSASFGYDDFKKNDDKLVGEPIKKMSLLTEKILKSTDYNYSKKQRSQNFNYLDSALNFYNKLEFKISSDEDIPMVYPLLLEDVDEAKVLRQKLIQNSVYIPTYWPNVLDWVDSNSIEFALVKNLLPLPIDQRYGLSDMEIILNLILDKK